MATKLDPKPNAVGWVRDATNPTPMSTGYVPKFQQGGRKLFRQGELRPGRTSQHDKRYSRSRNGARPPKPKPTATPKPKVDVPIVDHAAEQRKAAGTLRMGDFD